MIPGVEMTTVSRWQYLSLVKRTGGAAIPKVFGGGARP